MTMIVDPKDFASKAKLQAALNSPQGVLITAPGLNGNWTKRSGDLPVGFDEIVTNHPLRNKFAKISKTADGWKVK